MFKIVFGIAIIIISSLYPGTSSDTHCIVYAIGLLTLAFGLEDVTKNRDRK